MRLVESKIRQDITWPQWMGLLIVSLLIGLIVPFGIGQPWFLLISLTIVALVGFSIFLKKPHFSLYAMAIILTNPFDLSDKFTLPLAGLNDALELRELIFFVIVVLVLVEIVRNGGNDTLKKIPLSVPAIAFTGFVLASIIMSLFRGIGTRKVLVEGLPWVFYGIFPIVIAFLIKDEKTFKGVVAIYIGSSILGAVLALVQQFVGPGFVFIGSRQLKLFHGNVRIYTESEAMSLISLGIVVAYAVTNKSWRKRLILIGASILLLLGMFVSISRTIIVAEVLVVVLVVLVLGRRRWFRSLGMLAVIALLALIILSSIGLTSSTSILDTASEWFVRIFTEEGQSSLSIVGRSTQYSEAIDKIGQNPLTGVGLGNAFLSPGDYGFDPVKKPTTPYVVHNSYLQVAVKLGLIGLLLYLTWLIAGVKTVQRFIKAAPLELRPIGVGLMVGLLVVFLVDNVVAWGVSAPTLAQVGFLIGASGAYIARVRGHPARSENKLA